jgi:hypothetical protein
VLAVAYGPLRDAHLRLDLPQRRHQVPQRLALRRQALLYNPTDNKPSHHQHP